MILFAKLGCLALLLNGALGTSHAAGIPVLIPVIFTILLTYRCGIPGKVLLRKNYLIIGFAVVFSSLAVISGGLRGNIGWIEIARTFYKIILVYNLIFVSSVWIGKTGFLNLVRVLPGPRLKLFLILLHKTLLSFIKTSRLVLFQVRSRLDLTARGRLIVARYYVQNLLVKELYTFHFHQASLLTRLRHNINPYCRTDRFPAVDGIILILVIAYTVFAFSW